MESTTVSGRDESATKPAAEFAAELAKAAAKPEATAKAAAKAKPAAKRKAAAKKPTGAARRAREKAQAPASLQPVVSQDLEQQQPVPLELAGIGMELADIVTGYGAGHAEQSVGDAQGGESVEARGLTLEEVSQLLVSRERRGFERGHSMGYQSARQAAMSRLQRERSEAVAGALMMVARQLEGVLHDLAKPENGAKQEAARHLAVLTAEFAKAADRFANGEEFVA